ncbi:SH3 domain-containing protein [Enterocloster sp. OA13]|uniref:SH3 domain-containing protein n=1 Tax=Enterocloster hominis (ex Hitch et al. 2024) TaxID=1917870 RepID=A0ABV1DE35_9FIRM|nr:C40 family peptidase [Lachnoclostridium pacaense]EEQ56595.1 SH3 domain protein [Clostridiales bacterium 1_7_47FAA]MCC2879592.1 SH3 domain-containing protein [Lachnoclostridium pacaense]MCH1949765.1 SH3 domain-containing protein [Enterocloster sp. OA13]RJW51480.1 hydrolase Nlp/P60 [Clostridiales bacterium TF09-2AC]
MLEHKDYISSLNKARKKRNQNIDPRYLLILLAAVIVVGIIVLGVKAAMKEPASGRASGNRPVQEAGAATASDAQPASEPSPEEEAARKEAEEIQKTIDSYSNLGIVQVSGYLNIRETPSTDGKIIGKLSGDGACEILQTEGDWSHITSGGVDGYISNQYLISGDEAREKAKELVKLRATVTTDNLNIRQAPELDPSNVVGQALMGERYVVLGQQDGWIQIEEGYISADYAEVSYSLNEGRKLDMKAMAINQYDNLVISKVNNYLNVREEPKSDGKIIGKMTSKAAGEVLETLDGWYKIKSGPIIGYISADPQYTATGQEAKDIAMQTATLRAVINTDVLNVRTEPTTDAKIWTQIVKDERYPVVAQLDGWVEIELDSVDEEDGTTTDKAYISTRDNNVEVRYALNEAIKFSPAEVAANNAASRRSQIVNYALQFVGNPYVWGGTSLTKGADCSGFTMSVLSKFGVSLPHYSGSQAKMGKAVTSGNMRPGDLIFYAGSGGQVNHVAMYIGNGQIVHAASRKSGIKISTWNYRSPVAIRNVLGD